MYRIINFLLPFALFYSCVSSKEYIFESKSAESLFSNAIEKMNHGDLDSALFYFNAAHLDEPENTFILHSRGLLLSNLGNYEDALIDINKSINDSEIDNETIKIRIQNRALVYLQMGDTLKACNDWKSSNAKSYLKRYCY